MQVQQLIETILRLISNVFINCNQILNLNLAYLDYSYKQAQLKRSSNELSNSWKFGNLTKSKCNYGQAIFGRHYENEVHASSKTFSLKPTEEQCVSKVTVLTCWFDILLAWEAVDEYTRSVYIIR